MKEVLRLDKCCILRHFELPEHNSKSNYNRALKVVVQGPVSACPLMQHIEHVPKYLHFWCHNFFDPLLWFFDDNFILQVFQKQMLCY
jgi:hypothetical protein